MRKIETNADFVSARVELGLTANSLATILCTTPRTIRRMEQDGEATAYGRFPLFCRILEWMLNTGFRPPEFKARKSKRGRPLIAQTR